MSVPVEPVIREARIAIMTPYLYSSLDDMLEEEGAIETVKQVVLYGFGPSLSGVRQLDTPRYRVILEPRTEEFSGILPDLAISGCTEQGEEEVRMMSGFGILFARYSIFYGGPSEYTEIMPEDAGYAIDIPKDVGAVVQLLSSDQFLDGIIARDERQVVDSLAQISQGLKQPILPTPYLGAALRLPRPGPRQIPS